MRGIVGIFGSIVGGVTLCGVEDGYDWIIPYGDGDEGTYDETPPP